VTSADGYTPQALGPRVAAAARERGWRPVIGDMVRWGAGAAVGLPWTLRGHRRDFELSCIRYPYLYHRHKLTWLTERAVEVPVMRALVQAAPSSGVLEVGNVLSHYGPVSHTVLDRYERAPGVLNRDVLELEQLGPFQLIVAISTLEHVGLDERARDPGKAVRAVRALRAALAPGGTLALTVPAGYNPSFEAALRGGEVELSRVMALRRLPGSSRWHEVDPADAWGAPYDFLRYSARAVLFAFIDAPP
jgi:SAM-dependent methyltransferase